MTESKSSKAEPEAVTDPRVIDLDAAREARAAERGDPPHVVFRGEVWELPHELPVAFVDLMAEDDYHEAFAVLFGDEETARRFLGDAGDLFMEDFETLANGIADLYGVRGGLGNSSASGVSSSNTSKR